MLFYVITSGGELDAACIRAVIRSAGVSDHIRVEMIVDLRWFEPVDAGVDYYATPQRPEEVDAATHAFLSDFDARLEEYARICAEGSPTYSVRRVVGIPRKVLGRAARECDVLVLPHPSGATPEIRQAVREIIASPPCPLLVVGTRSRIRTATVCSARAGAGLNGSGRDLLRRLVRGRVERLRLPSGFREEDFAGWAPVVTATESQRDCAAAAQGSEEADLLAVLGLPRTKRCLALGRPRSFEPLEDGNTLLIPA